MLFTRNLYLPRILRMLFICAALGILLSIMWTTIRQGISPMPTPFKVWRTLEKALPESIEGPIADLGSGWGHMAFLLARKYPNNDVVGYEVSLIPYLVSQCWRLFCPRLRFIHKDFFQRDTAQYALIYCYLYVSGMQRLSQRPLKGLVYSYRFSIHQKEPTKTIPVGHDPIYLYDCRRS